jgi:hypothetical protein
MQKRFSPAILAFAVLVAVVSTCTITRRRPAPIRPPDTTDQLLERLEPLGFQVRRVPGPAGSERTYLTTSTRTAEDLTCLQWGIDGDGWRGVVRLRQLSELRGNDARPLGTSAWRFGAFVFFGDPEMLKSIQTTLERAP